MVMLHSFNNLVVIGGYYLNKNYIAANFCENKAKPELHCEGKCHLAKELQASEKSDPDESKIPFEEKTPEMYFQAVLLPGFSHSLIVSGLNKAVENLRSLPTVDDIFHPPRIA